jgi:uncharacterized protein YbaP (TraB family)
MVRVFSLFTFILWVGFSLHAQEKKYQSLLWEISGNGLQKKSYIYGSMHVSERISYHLSDAFFTHLLEADFVANESEPTTWQELYDLLDFSLTDMNDNAFFSGFQLNPFKKRQMLSLFRSRNFTMDNLLFRTNEERQDFQEDTYLDMFIYQTGRKYKKKTLGLEDVKESIFSMMDLDFDDYESIEVNTYKIARLLKGKSVQEALMDFYREKDLDMLDSLMTLTSPPSYLDAMLYQRNIIMAHSIDSIVKTGSLFAAIGAAHIPGKKGVVELLRAKGYAVSPVMDQYTDQGRAVKKQIDELFVKPEFETAATRDEMVRYKRFTLNIHMGEDLNSPDLTNGGYINVKRKPLHDFLKKEKDRFTHLSLDSLFYEFIPGDILSKTFFEHESGVGYDIKSKTKTGNAHRYRFYVTPLEIISVQMIGNGNYVRTFEEDVFPHIQLKKPGSAWQTVTSTQGGFQISMPEFRIGYGEHSSKSGANHPEWYAYDSNSKSYYFILTRTLGDIWNLEETAFELERIQREFLFQYDPEAHWTLVEEQANSLIGTADFLGRKIFMKTLVDGPSYYLMAAFDSDEARAKTYFSSFTRIPFATAEDFKLYTNKEYHFEVEIPFKDNELLFLKPEKKQTPAKTKKTNLYSSGAERFLFRGSGNRSVFINAYKYHPYESEHSLDSLRHDFKRWYKKNDSNRDIQDDVDEDMVLEAMELFLPNSNSGDSKKISIQSRWNQELGWDKWLKKRSHWEVLSEKERHDKETNTHILEALVSKAGSQQAIYYIAFFRDGMQYRFRTLVNRNQPEDPYFSQRIINSFKPLPSHPVSSVFEPKLSMFLKDVMSSNDTLRYTALKGIHQLTLVPEDLKSLQHFLDTFEFKSDETHFASGLYDKIGALQHPEVLSFLEKNYKKESVSPLTQLAILKSMTQLKSKTGYKKIMELMEYDLPLTDSRTEIDNLFRAFKKDLIHSETLFPDILQFYSIKEYHDPVLQFINELITQQKVNPKKLNSYKKMILTNAKLEHKRVVAWKAKRESQDEFFTTAGNVSNTAGLTAYIPLLYPFKKDKDVAQLIDKIQQLDIESIQLEIAFHELKQQGKLPEAMQQKLLMHPYLRFPVTQLLYQFRSPNAPEVQDEEAFSKAALMYHFNLNEKRSEIHFEEQRNVPYKERSISIMFFKVSPKKNGERNYYGSEDVLYAVAFVQHPKKEGFILPTAWDFSKRVTIDDEDDIPALKLEMIDRIINQHRLRVSFGRNEQFYGWDLSDFYD